jgi:hypothetical protein
MWHNLTKGDVALIKIALEDKGKPFDRIIKELDETIAEQEAPEAVRYREAAEKLSKDGELEIDSGAIVSMGDDPGAYVMAWVWVPDEPEKPH